MKKRSLAEAFQASLADEASGAAAAQHESDEEDYMSDAMLAMLERRDAPRLQTYSERRAQQQREEAERQRAEMPDAALRRSGGTTKDCCGQHARRAGNATRRMAGRCVPTTYGQYSPLWLDPTSLPAAHPLHDESVLAGENERGHDDAEALWLYALRDEGPPRAAPAPRERRVDAERFGALPLAARLALTVAYLREAYYYCVYCGHQYASESELQRSCPGPSEDEHG